MSETRARSPRYERKFFLRGWEQAQVRSLVRHHPAMFYETYPPRFVNNLYLDTPWMAHYNDNQAAAMQRRKVRVRWYHDLIGLVEKPMLEFKFKRGWVGWKEIYAFLPFTFDERLTPYKISQLADDSALPPRVKEILAYHHPALINRYRREYYATRDDRFRVTIDSELTYFRIGRLSNPLFIRQIDHGVVVVELKYDAEHEAAAHRVAARFPFRLTRNSKYVRGVERFFI
jgi:hypothetical protein